MVTSKTDGKMLIHFRPYAISSQEISNTLTKREKQILDRIVQGQSNLEIADALFVAESTVKLMFTSFTKTQR